MVAKLSPLLAGTDAGLNVYFVRSDHVVPDDDSVIATHTEHGIPFVSSITRDNLFSTRPPPENVQSVGLQLLKNFAAL